MGDSKDENAKIVEQFQKLREEQASIVSEISKVDEEIREHGRVLKLLEDVDGDRNCFQLLSDTLVEMKVSQIIPSLNTHLSNLKKVKDVLNESLVTKGKELNTHKDKHNIRFISEKEAMQIRQQQLQSVQPQKK